MAKKKIYSQYSYSSGNKTSLPMIIKIIYQYFGTESFFVKNLARTPINMKLPPITIRNLRQDEWIDKYVIPNRGHAHPVRWKLSEKSIEMCEKQNIEKEW